MHRFALIIRKRGIVMPHRNITPAAVSGRLKHGLCAAALTVGLSASGHALAAGPKEVDLASPAQALAYCNAGSLPKGSVAYFVGTAGDAQYASKCAQAVPKNKVKAALLVKGKTIKECRLASASQAIALCNNGGIGTYDIAYIAGPAATVIGGPGYGCGTNQTTLSIGNAICK
jgi:hypothetical protein